MVSPRRLLSGAAVCSAAVVLSAMLAGSANAAPANGCQNENSGANGQTCTNVGSDLYPGVVAGLHLKLPVHIGVTVNVPSCPDATASLVQAHLIVGGVNGKGGTARRLAAAEAADKTAHANLAAAELADKTEDAQDAAVTTAQSNLTTAQGELAAANAMTPDVPPAHVKADAIALANQHITTANNALAAANAADTGTGGEDPTDNQDAAVALAKSKAYDADKDLDAARNAEGRAEQGIVDAEVVIGQACKTPVVIPPTPPAPSTDNPAPPAPNEPVVISPALPSDGSAPTPVPVQASLPVTG